MKWTLFHNVFNLLSASHKRKGLTIIMLLVVNSLLDFLSVASFLPLIFIVVNPDILVASEFVTKIKTYLNFSERTELVLFVTVCIVVFVLLKTLVTVSISKSRANYIFSVGQGVSNRMLAAFMAKDYRNYVNADYSKEINRITNQPFVFANNIILPLANILSEGMIFLFILTCVALYNLKIILLLGAIILPAIIFYAIIRRRIKNVGNELKEIYPQTLKYGTQAVEGFIEIRTSGTETFFKNRFDKVSAAFKNALVKDHVSQTTSVRLTEVIAALIICGLVGYSTLSGHTYQETILLLSIYASASYRIIPSINRMMNASLQIRTHQYVIDEIKVLEQSVDNTKSHLNEVPVNFNESIELKNISFRHQGGPMVFDDLRLCLRKGDKIAITGNSGEGKTTLLLMLMGLIKADEGETFVDGQKLTVSALYNITSYVSQNPHILDASLAENIAFGIEPENIDRKKILTLLRDLDLTNLPDHLPEGIDTRIGEKGVKLSGGQRQRLAIARALYADGDILLLDEVTNQIQPSLETGIINLLDQLAARGKTIIIVTHKLTQPDFFDSIYQLEKGKLTEVVMQH